MDKTINKFYKLGIVSMEALMQYTDNILAINKQIEKILKDLSLSRNVNYIDRENYKTWTEEWKLSQELVNYGVELSKNKDNPMKYLSRVLADWHMKGINSIEEAKNNTPINNNIEKTKTLQGRSYSKEEINALFESIDDVEI